MGRLSLAERISALDRPEEIEEVEAIWHSIRPILAASRIVLVILIILVGEMFDDEYINGLTVGLWALVIGIPMIILISFALVFGDRFDSEEAENAS